MSQGDAYDILGVSPGAAEDEIKRAFRDLARRYHPDMSHKSGDDERFRAARRAYEELLDPAARAKVDRRRRAAEGRRRGGGDPGELLDLLAQALWSFGAGGSPHLTERLAPGEQRFEGRVTGARRFELDAILTPEEAREGIVIPFRFQLGPRLVSEQFEIPPGVKRGQKLRYSIGVAPDVRLDVLVHVDIDR